LYKQLHTTHSTHLIQPPQSHLLLTTLLIKIHLTNLIGSP
jgi:hypothetical protein